MSDSEPAVRPARACVMIAHLLAAASHVVCDNCIGSRAQSDGLSALDVASIALSLLALVAGFLSLWLTSLRRPNIEVEFIDNNGTEFGAGGFTGRNPTSTRLYLTLFVANDGASGTLVRNFRIDRFDFGPDFYMVFNHPDTTNASYTVDFPKPVERDGSFVVSCHLGLDVADSDASDKEFALAVARLRDFKVTVAWQWRRKKGLRMWKTEYANGSYTFPVQTTLFQESIVKHWVAHSEFDELVETVRQSNPALLSDLFSLPGQGWPGTA